MASKAEKITDVINKAERALAKWYPEDEREFEIETYEDTLTLIFPDDSLSTDLRAEFGEKSVRKERSGRLTVNVEL